MARHDPSAYCQVPRDSCLDRFRASLTTLVRLLSENDMSDKTEILIVEYNPCHSRKRVLCEEREGDYMTMEQALKTLVQVPASGKAPQVCQCLCLWVWLRLSVQGVSCQSVGFFWGLV